MKKICKIMAVFSVLAGLACMTSCLSIGSIVGSMFGQTVASFQTKDTSKEYAAITLSSNGSLEAIRYSNSTRVKGKWETSGSKDSVKDGDKITVTIEDKSQTGTVRHVSSKWVPLDPSTADSDRPEGDYTLTVYSINFGAWGSYTYEDKKYESYR